MTEKITVEEWLKEIERLSQQPSDDGYTVAELAPMLKLGITKTRRVLRQLMSEGKVRLGSRHVDNDWDGRSRTRIVYVFNEKLLPNQK